MSQLAAFTSGGPQPEIAYATRTPSGETQYRICWAARSAAGPATGGSAGVMVSSTSATNR